MTLFEISGDENATQLFEFFADPTNTGVEWTDAKIGYEDSGRNVVGTSHSEEFTAVGGYLRDTNYTLRSVSHNHPGGTGPSGRPGGLTGDIPNAALYHQRNPNTVLSVYIHPNNYIYYNQFGVIRQLPPVQITP